MINDICTVHYPVLTDGQALRLQNAREHTPDKLANACLHTDNKKQIMMNNICIVPCPVNREEQNSSMHRIIDPNCTIQQQPPANRWEQ